MFRCTITQREHNLEPGSCIGCWGGTPWSYSNLSISLYSKMVSWGTFQFKDMLAESKLGYVPQACKNVFSGSRKLLYTFEVRKRYLGEIQ